MQGTNLNERSWAIDLISDINAWQKDRNIIIKRAGGERTLKAASGSLFPDVLLFGDESSGKILQGWELKMPDTDIDNEEFVDNATTKARTLGLNSFLLWNVSYAVLYVEKEGTFKVKQTWDDLSFIRNRSQVEGARDEINKQLAIILTDLNQFFVDGVIRPATIIDAFAGDDFTSLILQNVQLYANMLKANSDTDTSFEDEVHLWWMSTRNEYPKSENMWSVLARNNLLGTLNKFVFAHALKNYAHAASLVSSIDADCTPFRGMQIFEDISASADFWNIFQTGLGDTLIPAASWGDFVELNGILSDLSISSVSGDMVHRLLDQLAERTKRKAMGQFATPRPLAQLIAKLVIEDASGNVIDPCCGTGTIVKAIYEHKKQKGLPNPLNTTWASDKFALPLKIATLSLTEPENIGELLRLFRHDAMELGVGEVVVLRDPKNGDLREVTLPEFSYVISNLPFVRQKELKDTNSHAADINKFIRKETGDENLNLSARSDLYAYLPFYFWRLLLPGGEARYNRVKLMVELRLWQ